jgi:hypothetical protein
VTGQLLHQCEVFSAHFKASFNRLSYLSPIGKLASTGQWPGDADQAEEKGHAV